MPLAVAVAESSDRAIVFCWEFVDKGEARFAFGGGSTRECEERFGLE